MPAIDRPRERQIWYDMKQKCYNPNNKSYNSYGAKGIRVCKEWKDDFEVFYKWFYKESEGLYAYLKLKPNTFEFNPENCYAEITKQITVSNRNTLVNKRFGKLVVHSLANTTTLFGKEIFVWNCICDCGKAITAIEPNLLSHKVTSCGCNFKEFDDDFLLNYKRTRLYEIYRGMVKRCYNPMSDHYKYYGGLGIGICDEWHYDGEKFAVWALRHNYDIGLSIERINNKLGYDPENCVWIDKHDQAKNKSTNVFIKFKDKTYHIAGWAKLLKLDPQVAKKYLLAHGGVIVENPNNFIINHKDDIEFNVKKKKEE